MVIDQVRNNLWRHFLWRYLGGLSLVLLSAAIQALPVNLSTPLEQVQWRYQGDKFACSLQHPVTNFGDYQLRQQAGGRLQLQLHARWLQAPQGRAQFAIHVPDWQRPDQPPELRYPMLWQQQTASADDAAGLALQALLHGWGWQTQIETAEGGFQVLAQAVNVTSAVQQFMLCRKNLLPRSFEQLRNLQLLMASGQSRLSGAQKQELDAVAAYVKADSRVATILVDAHTDGSGDTLENLVLSRVRSEDVVAYLVAAGVPAGMIEGRGHGERYPVASNHTAAGRRLNRRVTVRLELSGQRQQRQETQQIDLLKTLPQKLAEESAE